MDLSLLYTDDQTQASLTDSQTGDSDSLSFLLNPIENMLPSAYETATEADESSEIVTNISKYQEACLEKHTDSAQLNLSTSTYNTSECLSRCSELLSKDDDLRVDECFDSSEPILHSLPHLSEDLDLNSSKAKEFYIKKEPSLSLSLIDDDDTPEPLGAMSCFPKSLMEISTTEPLLSEFGFSSEHSEAAYTLRSLSPRSNSLDSDTAIAPVPDLYIFESETQDFILNPNIDPQEITCPEYQPLSQTEGKNTRCDSDQHFLMCDSGDVLTKCHHSSPEGQATVDYESDVSQHTWLTPPASDACEANSMSVNDARREAAEVTDFTLQASQSDSPVELWLDACQYLATEDTDDKDVLDKTSYTVMQGGLLTTGDLSFFPGETQGSGYNPEGSEGIGWSSEDVIGLGPRVERWSSVDSWATALSDWTGIVTASPEDITPVFTEIGAEIDALTRALAEVNTSSKEGQSQDTMGVQDQQFPESSVASGQSCFSVGPEFQDRDGSICDSALVTQRHKDPENSYTHSNLLNSSMGSTSATAAFSRGNSVNTLTLIPKSTSSADRDISEFGDGFLETDIFISNEDPILLNITEDTDDLEGQNVPADLIIKEPPGHGLCEVTDEHIIFQSSSVVEQEDKRCCGPVKIDGEETKPSADLHFPTTHTLTNSHVPGEDTQPDLNAHDYIHVSPDTLPDLDRACQVEPQWGSPKFIMPLAPLSIASSLICRTSSSLEGDQIYAKRSFNDKTDLCCDQVQPCAVWPTLDGITDKPSQEGDKDLFPENKNTIDSAECFFTERKTITEEFNDLSRELSYFTAFPADNFFISRKDRVAIITLDLNDPFAPRVEKSSITAAEMPHKTRSKKDKSASHHHVAQVSKKQENLSNHVSAEENRKQQEIHPLSGENHNNEITPAELEKVQAKLGIDTSVVEEKSSNKSHGKKKKKHGQNATTLKSVTEPLAELENGAKPKTAKGRIDMFEAKQGAKAEKSQKDNDQIHDGEKKSQQLTAKASQGERAENHVEHKESKKFTGPLNDDAIKRRRLSEDKFGKIVSALESKLPKPDVSIKVKAEEPKTDAEATRKKAYSEVVKQKAPSKADPTVVQPIQAVSVSGDPQSLCLWCQFAAVFSDYTVTWSREGTTLAEIKRSAGDESRVSVTISNASHKDLGKYQCRLSSLHGSVTLDYLLTYEVLSEIVIPQTPKTVSSAPVEVGSEEEDVHCSKLIFKEDFLTDQCFGDNHSVSIVTEKVHFGEGMHRRAFRTKLQTGQMSRLQPGHSCVLKVHNSLSYGTNNSDELVQKNFNLAVEECQVQNTARQYIKAYTAEAQSFEDFGDVPEIIPIYLVHRPSNDIPYATLEEELIGDFVKYSVKDGKEINLLRRDSEAGQKCCAFQHWVYHNTEGNLLVTDMQGVGMRLTDVGIATCKKGYKGFKGNCATSFIDQFKALHQCNMYCDILGLKSLQPKPKKSSAPKPKPQPAAAAPKKKTFGPTVKGKS